MEFMKGSMQLSLLSPKVSACEQRLLSLSTARECIVPCRDADNRVLATSLLTGLKDDPLCSKLVQETLQAGVHV
jgi:hypothetical protein